MPAVVDNFQNLTVVVSHRVNVALDFQCAVTNLNQAIDNFNVSVDPQDIFICNF